MFQLIVSAQFSRSLVRIKGRAIHKRVWGKVLELARRAPMGKTLHGNPYWSLRVGRLRISDERRRSQVIVADILSRQFFGADRRSLRRTRQKLLAIAWTKTIKTAILEMALTLTLFV